MALRQGQPDAPRDAPVSGSNDYTSAARSALVLVRLLNWSRSTGENYNLLLSRFGIERLLYWISVSPHAGRDAVCTVIRLLAPSNEGRRPAGIRRG